MIIFFKFCYNIAYFIGYVIIFKIYIDNIVALFNCLFKKSTKYINEKFEREQYGY